MRRKPHRDTYIKGGIIISYRVCVYAICKNESQFVERFMDSMSEADDICVLDTGSTDDTVEKLRARGAHVEQKVISPWRFDVARSESLKLIPKDADICCCIDLDEQFRSGWREKLERAWQPDTTRARYRYTWSFLPDGREGCVFWTDKIHKNGCYRWVNPVHEVLQYLGEGGERFVDAEGVQLDHHPDPSKSRGQYLPLLELAVREDPQNDRNRHYLGREYMFRGEWAQAVSTLKAHLREPYLEFADLLYQQKDWCGVIFMVNCALAITERPRTYICEPFAWGSFPYDLLSIAYFHLSQWESALKNAEKAFALAPDDARLQENCALLRAKIQKESRI